MGEVQGEPFACASPVSYEHLKSLQENAFAWLQIFSWIGTGNRYWVAQLGSGGGLGESDNTVFWFCFFFTLCIVMNFNCKIFFHQPLVSELYPACFCICLIPSPLVGQQWEHRCTCTVPQLCRAGGNKCCSCSAPALTIWSQCCCCCFFFFAGCGGGPALSCFSVLTLALRSFLVHFFFFNETLEC